jgi:hypothetical protein
MQGLPNKHSLLEQLFRHRKLINPQQLLIIEFEVFGLYGNKN